MKKLVYLTTALIGISVVCITSCKDDNTAPTITLIGNAHIITPKGSPYSDPGATASDDKDNSVYVINDVSYNNPKNPNTDVAGDYTVTYTAQDRSGNTSTATRTVSVTYTMWDLNHNYNVTDICLNDSLLNLPAYVCGTVLDTAYIFRTYITNFMNLFSGLTYIDQVGNKFNMPQQRPDGIFSPFIVSGSGTIAFDAPSGVYTWTMNYTFSDTTGISPTQTRRATFVSF
jgi:hypothetical protein